jgi:hypothetical protein
VRVRGIHALIGAIAAATLSACGSNAASTEGAPTSTVASLTVPTTAPSANGTTATQPHTPIPGPETGARPITLTAADQQAIVSAYQLWSGFDNVCQVLPVPGTLKAAVIEAIGVKWAFGTFRPAPGCKLKFSDGEPIDPYKASPFALEGGDTGIFEQQPGQQPADGGPIGSWEMNYFETTPFPCPDDLSTPSGTPGYDNALLPRSVVNALHLHYAGGCKNAYAPDPPR